MILDIDGFDSIIDFSRIEHFRNRRVEDRHDYHSFRLCHLLGKTISDLQPCTRGGLSHLFIQRNYMGSDTSRTFPIDRILRHDVIGVFVSLLRRSRYLCIIGILCLLQPSSNFFRCEGLCNRGCSDDVLGSDKGLTRQILYILYVVYVNFLTLVSQLSIRGIIPVFGGAIFRTDGSAFNVHVEVIKLCLTRTRIIGFSMLTIVASPEA